MDHGSWRHQREAALRLDRAGADGLVLFNRFRQPDIDADSVEVIADVTLSNQTEDGSPLHGSPFCDAGSTRWRAPAVKKPCATSPPPCQPARMWSRPPRRSPRHGPHDAAVLLDGLSAWMAGQEFREVRGLLAVPADADGADYERAPYLKAMRAANARHYFSWS